MLLAASGHSPCTSGLTSIRKSPVRSPALQATPSTSTDSRYWSAGKAGVGVNSSIGVSATKHKQRERLRWCGKKQAEGGQERPGAWENRSVSSEGTRRQGSARPQCRNQALLTGFHARRATAAPSSLRHRQGKGAVAFPREALLLGSPLPGHAVAQPPQEQHPRGRASPTT